MCVRIKTRLYYIVLIVGIRFDLSRATPVFFLEFGFRVRIFFRVFAAGSEVGFAWEILFHENIAIPGILNPMGFSPKSLGSQYRKVSGILKNPKKNPEKQ